MLSSFRLMAATKKLVIASLSTVVLLIVSFYGFGHWEHLSDEKDAGRLFSLIVLGILPLLLIFIIAIWISSKMSVLSAAADFQTRLNDLQQRLNAHDDLFRFISDSTPSALTIFNEDNQYWFVNASAARELGYSSNDILGKNPSAILGAEQGRRVEKNLDNVKKTNQPLEMLSVDKDVNGLPRYIQSNYHRLNSLGEFPGGIIVRDENVTNLMTEREQRENMLRQIISTLVAVVDRRDPYSSGHSARVGKLSRALAIEMQLTESEIDAAEIAGSLMNFGKVLVSRAILTKTESLTQDELQRIRDGILISADILGAINFNAPVVPTLRQVLERFDGTGIPNRLTGDVILMTTRIVVVANAFVALVSPRAYRPGADYVLAVQRLAQEGGTAYDPAVITVLGNFLTKNEAKIDWLSAGKPM